MRTRTERQIQRENRWQEIVGQQRASGQSVRAYCRQAGVQEAAFYWWRRKLAGRRPATRVPRRLPVRQGNDPAGSQPQRKPAPRARRKPSGALAKVGFLPVRVVAQPNMAAGRAIEILLGGQRLVRIPAGFDRQALADVLALLEARPC